jgi:transposase InsO family protein
VLVRGLHHVATWAGVLYIAFVVDTFFRRIVGWSPATSKETQLVLEAMEMGLWQRDRDGYPHQSGQLIHHSDAGSQYTSFSLAEHLDRAGIAASIGSVGDAYEPRWNGDGATTSHLRERPAGSRSTAGIDHARELEILRISTASGTGVCASGAGRVSIIHRMHRVLTRT